MDVRGKDLCWKLADRDGVCGVWGWGSLSPWVNYICPLLGRRSCLDGSPA